MSEPRIESTSRDVIESKLLTALQDDEVVACLFTESDIDIVIEALALLDDDDPDMLRTGLVALRREAFG